MRFFRKKPAPPAPPIDRRNWNDDWKVGDTAEVVFGRWSDETKPWERLTVGDRFTVTGFSEELGRCGNLYYFLRLKGLVEAYSTQTFRKVRPVATEESEVITRILNAKPGADNPRVDAHQNTTPSVRGTAGTSGNLAGEAYLGRGVLAGLFTDRSE